MKNKSTRHKELNTFKFQPFVERIANIDIDVFHKVGHEYETESEEDGCYFYQAIQNWSILNLTEGFDAFKKEVKSHTLITLPQLILDKDQIVAVLLKHLKLKDPLYLQPLLELVVAVAKDLRKDFYEHYKDFLVVLIDLLNTKDTDQLEWVFTCLAYLFKFLWRPLLKDITSVFNALLPLLSSNKPEYINSFAAGSFAFVARKVKDQEAFLFHILKTVKTQKDGIEGCGKLFFEVINGVDGQFHSCAESVLPFLINSLSNPKFDKSILFEILEQVVANISTNIRPQHSELLWTTLLASLSTDSSDNIDVYLKLLGQSIEYRNGKLLQNPAPVVKQVCKLLATESLPEEVLRLVTQIAILLLLSSNVKLSQEQASETTRKVLQLPHHKILLYFVRNVTQFSSFEALILPKFLKHCAVTALDDDSLSVLSHVIVKKAPLVESGAGLAGWSKYLVDFGNKLDNGKVEGVLKSYIEVLPVGEEHQGDLGYYVCATICLPHLPFDNSRAAVDTLELNIEKLLAKLGDCEGDKNERRKVLFLLNKTLECVVHIAKHSKISIVKLFENVLPLATAEVQAAKILDLVLTSRSSDAEVINMSQLQRLNAVLAENLTSPFHELRLITCHIYTLFEGLPEFDLRHSSDPDVPVEKFEVFSIFYRVESTEVQVDTYRDQVRNLERLNFDKPQMLMCRQTEFKTLPLRYLCGALYFNFKLLWDPTLRVKETHAHGLAAAEFWEVYGTELKKATKNIHDAPKHELDVVASKFDLVCDLYASAQDLNAKPDFVNYRLLLWKAMGNFPDIAEAKTRDVSELFLKFIESEFTRGNADVALTWNIRQNTAETSVCAEGTVAESAEKTKKGGRTTLQFLLNALAIFSKVRSPLSMYREPELAKLYFDLFQHKSHDVQKAALDCLMTYKHKYMTPYKENLYNLIDEKKFKNEVTAFSIDPENSSIQAEHRQDLIPIVLRVVFSKMTAKTGMRTAGSSGQFRRNLVLRFLAGCEADEMLSFVKMAFRFYAKYLKDDPEEMVQAIVEGTDLTKFAPPKRLQSALNLLNIIIEQFGGLMDNELLTFYLQIILVIAASVKGALDQASNVHAGYLAVLKTLRSQSTKLIVRFFSQFHKYPWNNKQINAVFTTLVWPYLDKLEREGIHSPTALLKLFVQWGSNPRYFPLLVKYRGGDENSFALHHVIRLFLNDKSKNSVINTIEDMIQKMLTLQPDEEDLQLVIPVDNLKPIAQSILDRVSVNEKLNYGSCVLLPHIQDILVRIKRKLESKAKKSLNQRELFILSRISELVWESDLSNDTLRLLLPVVLKRSNAGEEILTHYLSSISNLMSNVEIPEQHLRQLSPLFAEIPHASGRRLLCQILAVISTKVEKFQVAVDILGGLNAFDAKWVDQPDFDKRDDTFKLIQASLDDGTIDLRTGVLIIHTCFFMLKNEKSLSSIENTIHYLKKLCKYLVDKYKSQKDVNYILDETILASIRKGIASKSDDFRNVCISLLGHLARECPETHVVLRDLNKFTNSTELEVDFFENLTNIQLHRHARALLKFCQITKEMTISPNIRSLTQFILPLASYYLCNEKYTNKNAIIDTAIECIGTICRVLPWHQYEKVLKYYLTKLRRNVEYQKQLVRLTVAILDSFHFDLSKGQLGGAESSDDSEIQVSANEGSKTAVERLENKEIPPEINSQIIEGDEDESQSDEEDVDEGIDGIDEEDQLDTDEDEELNEEEPKLVEIKVCSRITVLCKSAATRATRTIQQELLPQLHKSLAEMTHHDASHKVNRKKLGQEREDEDLLKVPISLALVKLLQRLPKAILDHNLPGIFMKLCTFLKSHLESVRRVARETLQKIMLTLGPEYLNVLFGEMVPLLNRGFQIHVLVFTAHAILVCLKDQYKPMDIDKVLVTILELCKTDLFGNLADEKEVAKIAVKTSEAKSTKSFDTFRILAQYITDKCLMDLIFPIKNVLQNSHSFKVVQTAQECLRHVALGLVDNSFTETESLVKFAYGTASESIPELVPGSQLVKAPKPKDKRLTHREDCFIIPRAPVGRSGFRQSSVKASARSNAHLLVEFGLRLCFVLLKREKLADEAYHCFLDPFVVIFKNCLTSKHIKLSILTLQCLSWVIKYELPSMKEHIGTITKELFAVLHKYASAGLSKGDNFDLVVAAFKVMAVLVRDVKYYTVDTEQLKVLLLYVEQDMHDHNRQATAFNLLRAIISRKLNVPEIHDVMTKIAELSITSESNYVRLQSRLVFHHYFMDYPLGDKLEKHLTFYISQMSFEMQYGRESALEMMTKIILSFPIKQLQDHSGTLFVTIGARLVNDEVPECRKIAANCLTEMLNRLDKSSLSQPLEPLFDIVLLWLKDNNVSHRRLAAQLCGLFVNVEKSSFESRLPKLLPVVLKQFGLGKSKTRTVSNRGDSDETERVKDHHLYQVLQLLLKICTHCPSFLQGRYVENLAKHVQTLLAYPHEWVRLSAAQFIGFVLASMDIEELAKLVAEDKSGGSGYLTHDPVNSVKSLALDLCDQLQPGSVKADMAEQVIKNLVFVARVLQNVPITKTSAKSGKINLLWLTKRMRKIVNTEVVETPSSAVLRTEVFKWIAGLATVLELDSINQVLNHLLAPLVREMITTEESNAPLRQLSKQVGSLLKKRVGLEAYTGSLTTLQQTLNVKRAERKRARTQLAVTDPEVFAKKKIKRHEKKKELRKRKIADMKGRKNFKRRKLVDMEGVTEDA